MHEQLSGGAQFSHHKQGAFRQLESWLDGAGLTPHAFKKWLRDHDISPHMLKLYLYLVVLYTLNMVGFLVHVHTRNTHNNLNSRDVSERLCDDRTGPLMIFAQTRFFNDNQQAHTHPPPQLHSHGCSLTCRLW